MRACCWLPETLLLQLLTADQVEFWHHPEKAGWMHSQGEHIKTWRKRWFVLKQASGATALAAHDRRCLRSPEGSHFQHCQRPYAP